MAGRPASRGGDGKTYALVAFVILTVASLGAFIWQLTINKELQNRAETEKRKADKFGNPPPYYADESAARGNATTIANTMAKHLEDYASLVTGKKDMYQPAVEREARRSLRQIADANKDLVQEADTLLTAVNKLGNEYNKLKAAKAPLQAERDELAAENQQLAAGNLAARKEFEEEVAKLKEEMARVETEKDEAVSTKDKQVVELTAASEAQTEEMNKQRVDLQTRERNTEIKIARDKKLIEDYQRKIDELRPDAFDVNAILTKADGRVMRAIPGSDVIYVNLGERDKLRPGMGFEVFSPMGERVEGEYRGKASVEVVSVKGTTSECRITRQTQAKPIVEGDVVVNIAFERNRKTRFVVVGDFDLDYNDEIDWDGGERIAGLVREWGGQVVPQVDESVDFVVVGTGQLSGTELKGRPMSAVVEEMMDTRHKEFAQRKSVIDQARNLNIPVLTQTQFLYLTGERGGAFAQR